MPSQNPAHVFLSYAPEDYEIVYPLHALMQAEFSHQVWIYKSEEQDEATREKTIKEAIDNSYCVIFAATKNYINNPFILEKELPYILDKFKNKAGISLYPIPIDIEPQELPDLLKTPYIVDVNHIYDIGVDIVIEVLQRDMPVRPTEAHSLVEDWQPTRILNVHSIDIKLLCTMDNRFLSWSDETSNHDKMLRLWSWTGEMLAHHQFIDNELIELSNGRLLSRTWSRNTLHLWNKKLEVIETLVGHVKGVSRAQELPDRRILSVENRGLMRLWSADGKPLAILAGHTDFVAGVKILADGRFLSWSHDGTLRIWNDTGEELATMEGHSTWVYGVHPLNDGRFLSWSRDRTLRLWSAEGEAITVLSGHDSPIWGAHVLKDGRFLSWSPDKTIRLWSSEGELLKTLTGHTDAVVSVDVLEDGRFLSVSRDRTLRLWSNNGEALKILSGHRHWVEGVKVLPDGRFISWSRDGSLRLWGHDGEALTTMTGHTHPILEVFILKDRRFVSCAADWKVQLWSAEGKGLRAFVNDVPITICRVSQDEQTVLVGDKAGKITMLQLAEN